MVGAGTGVLCAFAFQPVPASVGLQPPGGADRALFLFRCVVWRRYQQDLPFGFSAGFQPAYFITRYDALLPAFGKTRSDDTVMLAFTLLNRRFDYHGFTPRFSYVFTEQHSNIPLYSFTRSQFQI